MKIIIVISILIVYIIIINFNNLLNFENFNTDKLGGLMSGTKTTNNKTINNIQTNANDPRYNLTNQSGINNINNVIFSNKDYNENLSIDNKNNKYYYNDMINQDNINETSFNIINSIDPINYSDIETGIEKCNKNCKGICFENGYDGIATCYPKENKTFDWGTLYKNPTFTFGYGAYNPNNSNKNS